eukprot:360277-Chlamydomonas_euryale.AAC.4
MEQRIPRDRRHWGLAAKRVAARKPHRRAAADVPQVGVAVLGPACDVVAVRGEARAQRRAAAANAMVFCRQDKGLRGAARHSVEGRWPMGLGQSGARKVGDEAQARWGGEAETLHYVVSLCGRISCQYSWNGQRSCNGRHLNGLLDRRLDRWTSGRDTQQVAG